MNPERDPGSTHVESDAEKTDGPAAVPYRSIGFRREQINSRARAACWDLMQSHLCRFGVTA